MAQHAADIAKQRANQKCTGYCAMYIADALQKAGFNFARQKDAYQYHTNEILKNMGFIEIPKEIPQKGDICVTNRSEQHPSGHIAIYDGQIWISDFLQSSVDIYNCNNEKYFYRATVGGERIWLPEINGFNKNDPINGYAGQFGKIITGLIIDGVQQYRVHIYGGSWLPPVIDNNHSNRYAGTHYGSPIDAVAISGGINYTVHIQGGDWLPIINGYNIINSNKGYAGIIGKPIDAVMIQGKTYAVSYNN